MSDAAIATQSPGKFLVFALWAAQFMVFALFCLFGFMKLTTPIADLSHMMPWTGPLPVAFVRTMGVIDIAGGIGIFWPGVTRIAPKLGVLAAAGCVLLQICAICFHASRGEFNVLPLNFFLLPLCSFVLWGRGRRAPIVVRG
jgi:hypothetical protein